MSSMVIAEPGDLTAEPGSRLWAVAIRREVQHILDSAESNKERLGWYIEMVLEHEVWRIVTDSHDRPFRNFRHFCETRPPFGLGYSPEAIDMLIQEAKSVEERAREAKPLAQPGEVGRGRNRVSNRNSKGGENADYLTARIARDNPTILEKMKAGEYESVRQAALDAGIIRKRISIAVDPELAARSIRKHFTEEQVAELLDYLETGEWS